MAKFTRYSFAKTTANCFNSFGHFRLISSVIWSQRPLINYDCIYFSFPSPPPPPSPVANISGKPVPPTFLFFLRPWHAPKISLLLLTLDEIKIIARVKKSAQNHSPSSRVSRTFLNSRNIPACLDQAIAFEAIVLWMWDIKRAASSPKQCRTKVYNNYRE
jgi:hypothetical protein